MVKHTLAILLIPALALAVDKPYYQFPDAGTVPANGRFLMYDPAAAASKNVTGATLKAASTPQACVEYFDGADGATGPQGPAGNNGANGIDGSQIYTGLGAPVGIGVNSDFYLNTSNGDYYQKLSGAWTLKGNLTGPTGPPGPSATVDQPAVLSALATPGGNPDERQPLSPQTNSTSMRQVRDLAGNVRWFVSGDGTIKIKDAAGKTRVAIDSSGQLTTYRGDGTTVAFQTFSGARFTGGTHTGTLVIN